MNIKQVNNIKLNKNITKAKKEDINNNKEQKNIEQSSLDCCANYNVAFMGLNRKEDAPIDYTIKAKEVTKEIQMQPYDEYLLADDSRLLLYDFEINFQDSKIKNILDNIPVGGSIILGRQSFPIEGMTRSVSREHLKLKKNSKGEILATDLNTTNGTKILPNIKTPDIDKGKFRLERNVNYELPENSILWLGNGELKLGKYERLLDSLKEGESITIGRSHENTIMINDPAVSKNHLLITKGKNGLLVKDLNSKNGTIFEGTSPINTSVPYADDFYNIRDTKILKKNVPTLLPKVAQINIGDTYTIDTRNKNIQDLLNRKGSITIGRSQNCDIVVNQFHEKVSREHLRLEKSGNHIIATDLNAINPSRIIPKNKIKAFYCGVKDIKLAQANIGDCYLLSSIYSLSQTQKGQEILEEMVQIDNDGNYIVSFYNEPEIKVRPEELDGQEDKKKKEKTKHSVSGELGAKALERAYGKLVKSGHNEECEQTLFAEIDDGGFMDKALEKMTGIKSNVYRPSKNKTEEVFNNIAQRGIENCVVTCSTPKGKYGKYVDPNQRFLDLHAYSIKNVDTRRQLVEIVDPHNTTNSKIISWDEFNKIFDRICYAKI